MIKENLLINNKEVAYKIRSTAIDAIRKKDISKKGLRIYKDGFIGVSGSIGQMDDKSLEERALKNLDIKIAYDHEISGGISKEVLIDENKVSSSNLNNTVDDIIHYLRENHKEFDFSESIKLIEKDVIMKNDRGLDLHYKDSYLNIELSLKNKKLANLFDGFVAYRGRNFDFEKFKSFNNNYLNAYLEEVKLPKQKKIPLIIGVGSDGIFNNINLNLNGERYGSGVSLFANKLGNTIFNEKINIVQTNDPKISYGPFFDLEGVVNENFEYPLIEDGVLKAVYNNKKIAKKYNQAHTGASSSDYDSVPSLSYASLHIKKDSEELCRVIKENGGYAVVVIIAAGGDFTSEGDFASPVQISLLYDGEKFIGKLPEFSISSNLYRMFGKDYIGTFDSPLYFEDDGLATMIMIDTDI